MRLVELEAADMRGARTARPWGILGAGLLLLAAGGGLLHEWQASRVQQADAARAQVQRLAASLKERVKGIRADLDRGAAQGVFQQLFSLEGAPPAELLAGLHALFLQYPEGLLAVRVENLRGFYRVARRQPGGYEEITAMQSGPPSGAGGQVRCVGQQLAVITQDWLAETHEKLWVSAYFDPLALVGEVANPKGRRLILRDERNNIIACWPAPPPGSPAAAIPADTAAAPLRLLDTSVELLLLPSAAPWRDWLARPAVIGWLGLFVFCLPLLGWASWQQRQLSIRAAGQRQMDELRRQQKEMDQRHRLRLLEMLGIFDDQSLLVYAADMQTYELVYVNQQVVKMAGHPISGGICYRELYGRESPCTFCTMDILRQFGRGPYVWEYNNPVNSITYQMCDYLVPWVDGRSVRMEVASDVTIRRRSDEALRRINLELEKRIQERTLSLQKEVAEKERADLLLRERADELQHSQRIILSMMEDADRTRLQLEKINQQLEAQQRELQTIREHEVNIATAIQRTLLIANPPGEMGGLEIGVCSIPSLSVDGDFLEYFNHGHRLVDIIVGDVMGKGIQAALLGAAVKSQLARALSIFAVSRGEEFNPKEIVTRVKNDMARQLISLNTFVTLNYSRFDVRRRRLQMVDCGHLPVIHLKKRSGHCDLIKGESMPLGFADDTSFDEVQVPFDEGDVFLVYSDGLTEARNGSGEQYGLARLVEFMRGAEKMTAAAMVQSIREDVTAFCGTVSLQDDFTCVAVRIHALPQRMIARENIRVSPGPESLETVRRFVTRFCRQHLPGMSERTFYSVYLAAHEAAIHVGHVLRSHEGNVPFDFEMELTDDRMILRLKHAADGEAAIGAPDEISFSEGLSLFIMRNLLDESEIHVADGMRTIEMTVFVV